MPPVTTPRHIWFAGSGSHSCVRHDVPEDDEAAHRFWRAAGTAGSRQMLDGVMVLADPEGNELCVLEPRETYAGVERIAAVVLDCNDPVTLAPFWLAATGWRVGHSGAGFVSLRHPERPATALELVAVPEPKTAKNRLHVDIAPFPDDDHAAEVARLAGLGARTIDVGQRDVGWEVLADPEGHELCVLSAR